MLVTVEIRSPLPPDDDDRRALSVGPDADFDAELDDVDDPDAIDDGPPPDHVSFRVPTRIIVAKFGAAALIAVIAAFAPQTAQLVVGLVVAASLAGYAARDVVARERLRADADGLVAIRGYAGRRHLAWDEIERLAVDDRTRFGAPSQTLEIDAEAELFLFSRNDLGVDPDEALTLLAKLRP